ncbi:DUF2625 domain-containing protein [Rugosimonospora acidiphila]|uniref:DUF2625 domain-containing protein n=1 Tax=Rugosimonospora acidiphila TaxID=556531 RepID=A0ABP9RMC3_9ACTN
MEESAWTEVAAAVSAAPYPVEVLPADPARAQECLATLGMTTRSWLGAVVSNVGALVVDHGWLRVLGCGHDGLPGVDAAADAQAQRLIVAYDVMGGQFAWMQAQPGAPATVHYFGPDSLGWEDLKEGYAGWLAAMLGGALTDFYRTLRWAGWEAEVGGLTPDQGISAWPPPFSREGKDVSAASRKAVPLAEVVSFYQDTADQLGSPEQS